MGVMRDMRNRYTYLMENLKGPLGSPRRRWKYTIKTNLKEIGCEGGVWMQVVQDLIQRQAFVNTVMTMRFEVLMVVRMTILLFWFVTPCRLLGRYRRFAETCCLHTATYESNQ
jgi:hypothetical protein